jgi:hypothetical protein
MSYVATMPASLYRPPYRGMGDALSASKNVAAIGGVTAGAATALAGALAASGAGVMGISAAALSAAVPFIGPALMGATLLVQYLVANSGCGITCVETSQWANQAADALQKVMDGYFALPAPRTQTQKALAVANFRTIWRQLQQACGQPGTGNAGVRCISDRQQGACTWRQKYAPVYPGQPNIGECWNWFNGYLGPIQQDPVVPDPVPTVSGAVSDLTSSLGLPSGNASSLLPLALIAGLVIWAVS